MEKVNLSAWLIKHPKNLLTYMSVADIPRNHGHSYLTLAAE
ncbi:MAG: hypothetical protein Q8L02_00300 [Candidatus Nitrotoga sp.]|nr:hypothetical protein [Candidatus Nitrotoga sp.]